MEGKRECATYGGKLTGPRTEQAKANLKHEQHTNQAQTERREASAQLSQLEDAMHLIGMNDAPRSTVRKAKADRKLTALDDVRAWLPSTSA